jgi:hypothetical protein
VIFTAVSARGYSLDIYIISVVVTVLDISREMWAEIRGKPFFQAVPKPLLRCHGDEMKSLGDRVRQAQQDLMGNRASGYALQSEYRLQEDLEVGNDDSHQDHEDTVLIGGIYFSCLCEAGIQIWCTLSMNR